jgi:hypothetical protein
MTDDLIPELALGYARLGGYRAAVGLANRQNIRDSTSAWIVADRATGLIRALTTKQVLDDYKDELTDLNDGNPLTVTVLGKTTRWWNKRAAPIRNDVLAEAVGTSAFQGLDLGGRAFIIHRPDIPAPPL